MKIIVSDIMSSIRRLDIIQNHVTSKFPPLPLDPSLDNYRKASPFNQQLFAMHYFDDYYPVLLKTRQLMDQSPLFNHQELLNFSIEENRGRVIEQLIYLYSSQKVTHKIDKEDPLRKLVFMYPMAEYDLSLSVRFIVHLILYVDTLQSLGTAKHAKLIEDAYSLKDYGSFGMTELGHGSNVAAVETTATFDETTGGFYLHSPTATSAKWWIGAAANTANRSVIFAQLIVGGINKGVHVFAIPIRDYETHEPLPGVTIGDCGQKSTVDGIDNGFIMFNNYLIQYDCLLDRTSQMRSDGRFKSSIKNKDKRLGVMMAGLIRGRLAVVSGSEINARCCLTIALRYATIRKQFGTNNENSLIAYQLHRYRLIPKIGQVIAIRCGVKAIFNLYLKIRQKADADPECDELNELHSMLSSVKAVASWLSLQVVQECRESCGGLGISLYTAIARYKGYQDVHATWEGDNNVLIQQTAKYILKVLQKSFKGQKITPPSLKFLKFDYEDVKKFKIPFLKNEDFEDPDCLLQLMEHRVNLLMHTSVLKLQENSMVAEDMNEAWNNSQVFCIQDLAKSFGELTIAKEFLKFALEIEKECKETGKVIKKFFCLFALERIVNSISCYLEGPMDSAQEKTAKDCILRLCNELAGVSVNVLDSLAASDKIIGSALGATDGQAYAKLIQSVEAYPKVYSRPSWLHLIKEMRKD